MRPSSFPIHLWSCYKRTLAGKDRNSNFSKAAHCRLQTILGIDHPTTGRFLGEMKKARKLSDYTYEQCIRRQPAPKKRRVYLETEKRGFLPWWSSFIKETCWNIFAAWHTTLR
uniref:Uncharacterized protein n=1 Tax=Ditylenchus dipsaci TaxID=166011 RepID=A0A915ENG2_9BILA